MFKLDVEIQNVKLYNSYFKKFYESNVYIQNGKIYYVDRKKCSHLKATQVINGAGRYMIPGLIDIHMHIESSMMTPEPFCERLAACGVTTIVSEPHEMANVNGINGILDMIKAGANSYIDVFYGIPSSVPSTNDTLETTGGKINFQDMLSLKKEPAIVCVGEVMNYRHIIEENDLEISKFLSYIRNEDKNFVVEGHCPSLIDLDLAKYLYLGINGDHTEHSIEELKQRFENGMFVEIQEKMLNKEVIDFIQANKLFEYFGFVTDDVMADKLMDRGHLDTVLRNAIALGMPAEQAIYNATYTNAQRMHFYDRGVLVPGKLADFLLLDDLDNLQIHATYKKGVCIYNIDKKCMTHGSEYKFPKAYYHTVKCLDPTEDNFEIKVKQEEGTVKVRVMYVQDGSTQTKEKIIELPVKEHKICWQNTDFCLAVVIERYGKTNNIGYGFVSGDSLKEGAVATTYAHDSHNLLVVGNNIKDMNLAANRVIEFQGGIVTVDRGEIEAELPLPIGGILSDQSIQFVGTHLKQICSALLKQGYRHNNPIMSLCTLTLPVSPSLKLTDKGLVDVINQKIVSLIV